MRLLPITYTLFTSTKGHHSRKTDYRLTLDHWDRQVPLSLFNLIAHIKVTPGEERLAEEMVSELHRRGFYVLQTVGTWQRGLSHGASYLGDQVTVSKDPRVYSRPYFLLVEDDSPVVAHDCSLEDLLLRSCQMLADNHELVTVRTIRKCDYDGGVPQLAEAEEGRAFASPHVDYQPLVMRSLDFLRLAMILEANPQACAKIHCERLWALILSQFSRSPHKHLVWKPDWAETVHLGVPDPAHSAAVRSIGLTPYPTYAPSP